MNEVNMRTPASPSVDDFEVDSSIADNVTSIVSNRKGDQCYLSLKDIGSLEVFLRNRQQSQRNDANLSCTGYCDNIERLARQASTYTKADPVEFSTKLSSDKISCHRSSESPTSPRVRPKKTDLIDDSSSEIKWEVASDDEPSDKIPEELLSENKTLRRPSLDSMLDSVRVNVDDDASSRRATW